MYIIYVLLINNFLKINKFMSEQYFGKTLEGGKEVLEFKNYRLDPAGNIVVDCEDENGETIVFNKEGLELRVNNLKASKKPYEKSESVFLNWPENIN